MSKKNKSESYLVFYLENELFTIHVNKILSILEMKKITKIPESPDYMRGVINLRGEVLPIIDSHTKFSLPPINISMKTSIVVLEIKTQGAKIKLGLVVDKVEEVIQIVNKDILPPPNIGDAFESKYIKGMYKKDDKSFIMIIDIDKVLSLKEIVDLGGLKSEKIIEGEDKKKKEEINTKKNDDGNVVHTKTKEEVKKTVAPIKKPTKTTAKKPVNKTIKKANITNKPKSNIKDVKQTESNNNKKEE